MPSRRALLAFSIATATTVLVVGACYHGTNDVPRVTGASSSSTTGAGGQTPASSTTGAGGLASSSSTGSGGAVSSASSSTSSTSSTSSSGGAGTPTFAVAGYGLRRIVSTDGVTWLHDISAPPLPADAQMLDNIGTGIAFGKGTCAVVADSGLVTTRDGINWTKIGAPLPQAWYGLGGGKVIFDGNMFLIVASGDTYTSTDGVTWSKFSTADTSTHWAGLQFGNGHYVAVGDTNRKASEDGQTWHDYVQGGPGFTGLAFGNGVFVAVGDNGLIETTPDGVTWTVATDTVDAGLGDLSNIVFANGAFLTCAPSSSYSVCLTSTDGLTWTSHAATHAPNGPLGFGMGLYISVTWESNIWTSTDGLTWKEEFSGDAASNPLASVGFGLLGP